MVTSDGVITEHHCPTCACPDLEAAGFTDHTEVGRKHDSRHDGGAGSNPELSGQHRHTSSNEQLIRALKDLSRAYVSLMETGRDRIVALGGDCDSVEVMERGDPYLRKAREAVAAAENSRVETTDKPTMVNSRDDLRFNASRLRAIAEEMRLDKTYQSHWAGWRNVCIWAAEAIETVIQPVEPLCDCPPDCQGPDNTSKQCRAENGSEATKVTK